MAVTRLSQDNIIIPPMTGSKSGIRPHLVQFRSLIASIDSIIWTAHFTCHTVNSTNQRIREAKLKWPFHRMWLHNISHVLHFTS